MRRKTNAARRERAASRPERYLKTRWVHPGILMLGAWLILGPAALGQHDPALVLSDLAAGVVLVALGLSFAPHRGWVPWGAAITGVWLLLAPGVLWASSPVAYASDTLIGTLVVVLSVVMPRSIPTSGPEIPPGWSYNPSGWRQRATVVALALVGFAAAAYMAAYQLGYIAVLSDPFFGDGTQQLLDRWGSHSLVPVAGLGASVYLFEALIAATGNSQRWRTMPWMVALFGIIAFAVAATATTLAILPGFRTGAWCTPCLVAGTAALLMLPLTGAEMMAMFQFLVESGKGGAPLWHTFWYGLDRASQFPKANGRCSG